MATAERVHSRVGQQRQTPGAEAWALLRELLTEGRRRFMTTAADFGLHPAQAGALMEMQPGAPMPMSELAATLACDNSNVTGIVDRLEARGLVTRQPYEQDRRVKHLALTPLGVDVREQIRARMAELPAAIERLSASDQRLLRDLLRRALDAPPA